jgi:hypothetical protein
MLETLERTSRPLKGEQVKVYQPRILSEKQQEQVRQKWETFKIALAERATPRRVTQTTKPQRAPKKLLTRTLYGGALEFSEKEVEELDLQGITDELKGKMWLAPLRKRALPRREHGRAPAEGGALSGHSNPRLAIRRREGAISGGGGVGKSYVIDCLRRHPKADRMLVLAPTGCAAFNVDGNALHSALRLPARRAS